MHTDFPADKAILGRVWGTTTYSEGAVTNASVEYTTVIVMTAVAQLTAMFDHMVLLSVSIALQTGYKD